MLIPFRVTINLNGIGCFTHAFVHADWMHLAFNMFVLYEFGQTVEADLGHVGLVGVSIPVRRRHRWRCTPALLKHRDNRKYRSLGASGAVSAVLMSFILLHPDTTLLLFFVIPVPAVLAGVLFFGTKAECTSDQVGALPTMLTWAVPLVGLVWTIFAKPEALALSLKSLWSLLG